MTIALYVVQGFFAWMALGLFTGYQQSGHKDVLLGGLAYGGGAGVSFHLMAWWPLVAAYGLAWLFRVAGFDPGARGTSDLRHAEAQRLVEWAFAQNKAEEGSAPSTFPNNQDSPELSGHGQTSSADLDQAVSAVTTDHADLWHLLESDPDKKEAVYRRLLDSGLRPVQAASRIREFGKAVETGSGEQAVLEDVTRAAQQALGR